MIDLIFAIAATVFLWGLLILLPASMLATTAFEMRNRGEWLARFLVPVPVLYAVIGTVVCVVENFPSAAKSPVYRYICLGALVVGVLAYLQAALKDRMLCPEILVCALAPGAFAAMKQVAFPSGFVGDLVAPFAYMAACITVPTGVAQLAAGLLIREWRENRFFWWSAVGFAASLGGLVLLHSQAPALVEMKGLAFVVLLGLLATFVTAGFAYGMGWNADADRQAYEAYRRRAAANPGPRVEPAAQPRQSEPETVRDRGQEFELYVRKELEYLPKEFVMVYGARVRGVGESEIDHVVIGPNGIWVIEDKYRYGTIRIRNGLWQFRNGATGELVTEENPGAQNEKHVIDLQTFLRRHLGDTVDRITFHNVVCISERTEWDGPDEFPGFIVRTPQALRMEIAHGSGTNPLPPETYPGMVLLLLQEAAECQRRYLERKGVPGPFPRLRRTAFEVLGISPAATQDQVRERFRELARRYHPDATEGGSDERFKEISDAYTTLSKNRREYVWDLVEEMNKILEELADIAFEHGV